MRISNLSEQSGVPVATIKFYLREGLLQPGVPTARNQAVYDTRHLRRLRLIRALTTIGQLDLSSVRELLSAVLDEDLPLPRLYQVVHRSLSAKEPASHGNDGAESARADVDGFISRLGWQVAPHAPGRSTLAQVMAALRGLGCESDIEFLAPYAAAADELAVHELDLIPADGFVTDRAAAVARTVLLEVALTAMRRMAQEHHVALRFGPARSIPRRR